MIMQRAKPLTSVRDHENEGWAASHTDVLTPPSTIGPHATVCCISLCTQFSRTSVLISTPFLFLFMAQSKQTADLYNVVLQDNWQTNRWSSKFTFAYELWCDLNSTIHRYRTKLVTCYSIYWYGTSSMLDVFQIHGNRAFVPTYFHVK